MLLTVSPQPPSGFWCPASQAMPPAISFSCAVSGGECFWTSARALTAVAVDRADVDSSPTQ